jgi:hypothetical protein
VSDEYYAALKSFRNLCTEFGVQRVLRDLKDLDLNLYHELTTKTSYSKPIPAILKGIE